MSSLGDEFKWKLWPQVTDLASCNEALLLIRTWQVQGDAFIAKSKMASIARCHFEGHDFSQMRASKWMVFWMLRSCCHRVRERSICQFYSYSMKTNKKNSLGNEATAATQIIIKQGRCIHQRCEMRFSVIALFWQLLQLKIGREKTGSHSFNADHFDH